MLSQSVWHETNTAADIFSSGRPPRFLQQSHSKDFGLLGWKMLNASGLLTDVLPIGFAEGANRKDAPPGLKPAPLRYSASETSALPLTRTAAKQSLKSIRAAEAAPRFPRRWK